MHRLFLLHDCDLKLLPTETSCQDERLLLLLQLYTVQEPPFSVVHAKYIEFPGY